MSFTGNPFSKEVLKFPNIYKESLKKFVQTSNQIRSPVDYLSYPFKRQLDFWSLALSLGFKFQSFDEDSSLDRFVDAGMVLGGENRLNCLIFSIAISKVKDPYIVKETSKCIDIANKYAAGGTPLLLEWLENGNPDQTGYVAEKIIEIIDPN